MSVITYSNLKDFNTLSRAWEAIHGKAELHTKGTGRGISLIRIRISSERASNVLVKAMNDKILSEIKELTV